MTLPRAKTLLPLAALSLISITPVLAQDAEDSSAPPARSSVAPPRRAPSGGPPNFVPGPPPSTPPPPRMVPPPRATERTQGQEGQQMPDFMQQAPQQQEGTTQATMPAAGETPNPARLAAPGVNLRERVGLIRIPDLGANEVIEMLENMTERPVLRRQDLPAVRITFFSRGELTRAEAITAIESLLAINGIAVMPMGDTFLKAVPMASATTQVPVLIEESTLDMEASQQVYSKIFQLDFLTSAEAMQAAQGFITQGAPVEFAKNNAILITDSLVNLQRVEILFDRLDKPAPLNTEMRFFQLRNIGAQDALRRMQTLQQGSLRNRLEGNTTVDADERTNQLIVFTHPSNISLIEQIVERLDMDVEPLTRTETFSIRHADAVEVSEVIREVVTGQERVRDQQTGQRVRRPNQPQPQQPTSDGPGVQFSQYITIVPDERTNTIVATGTQSDLRLLEQLIDRLDTILPQVRIEVVIAEVTLGNQAASGLSEFGIKYGRNAPGDAEYPLEGGGYDVPSGEGLGGGNKDIWLSPRFNVGDLPAAPLSIAPFALEHFSFDLIFRTAEANSRVRVLSAPTIVTTHNREASIIVGDQIPVVTSTATGLEGNGYQTSQVQFRDVTLELNVKPLIGSNGIIQMEIEQKYDTLGRLFEIGGGVADQPSISTRQATSFVSVGSGQMVVLGGLQRLEQRDGSSKVFILGDLPIIGELFRPKNNSSDRTELLIFIRPVVVENSTASHEDAELQINRQEAAEEIRRYMEQGHFRAPPAEEAQEPTRVLRRGQWVEVQEQP